MLKANYGSGCREAPGFLGPCIQCGSEGSQPTLSSLDYSPGYSLERATLEDGQSAAVRALTTFGAGFCIASQRS